MKEIRVPQEGKGERLDRFLARALGMPRNQVQKLIARAKVLITGRARPAHTPLKIGDVVSIEEDSARPSFSADAPSPALVSAADDFIVIEKPVGLLVHPAPKINEPTLVDWLLSAYPEMRSLGEGPERAGLVHRLDRLASGLMVVPRTSAMFEHLKRQFQVHAVVKEYLALVDGVMPKADDTISFPLTHSDRGRGKMAARPSGEEGKAAVTHFVVEQQGQQATLVRVRTETGRTHQVRAHLAAYGHPILGDPLYRSKSLKVKRPIPRLMLHATHIAFTDLAGQTQDFISPPPQDFSAIIQELIR